MHSWYRKLHLKKSGQDVVKLTDREKHVITKCTFLGGEIRHRGAAPSWHPPCILHVSLCGSRGQRQCHLYSRVQVGTEVGHRLRQPESQTFYKFVNHCWWHPHYVMECTRAFISQLHHQHVIQPKLHSSHNPSSNSYSSWMSSSLSSSPSV